MRRLRRTEALRGLVRETELSPAAPDPAPLRRRRRGRPRGRRLDARHRALLDLRAGRRGDRDRRRGHRRRAALRHPRRQGRVGLGRLRRRGRRADGGAGAEGGPPRPDRDHRRLPLRVHLARPLRLRPRRRGRQRHHGRAAGQDRDLPRRGRRRRGRAQRHDGRPGRHDPPPARRGGPLRTCRSSPTAPSTPPPSTAPSATPPSRPPSSATAAATRWTRPTPPRRCARRSSTSRRAPTC